MKKSPQTVPNAQPLQIPPQEMVGATGFEPVAPTIVSRTEVDNTAVAANEGTRVIATGNEFRPQTVPNDAARRLSRAELRALLSVLNGEINRVGLDQEHGRRAAALKEKLLAIHAHGWEIS